MDRIINESTALSSNENVFFLIDKHSNIKRKFEIIPKTIDVGFGLFLLSTDEKIHVFLESGEMIWSIEVNEKILKAKFIDRQRIATLSKKGFFKAYSILQQSSCLLFSVFVKTKETYSENLSDFTSITKETKDIYLLCDAGTVLKLSLLNPNKTEKCKTLSISPEKAAKIIEEREITKNLFADKIQATDTVQRTIFVYYQTGLIDVFVENKRFSLILRCCLNFKEVTSSLCSPFNSKDCFFFREKAVFVLSVDNPSKIKAIKRFDLKILSIDSTMTGVLSYKLFVLLENNTIVESVYTKQPEQKIKPTPSDGWKPDDIRFGLTQRSLPEDKIVECKEIARNIETPVKEISEAALELNVATKEIFSRIKTLFALKELKQSDLQEMASKCLEIAKTKNSVSLQIEKINKKGEELQKRYLKTVRRQIAETEPNLIDEAKCKEKLENIKDLLQRIK